MSRGSIGALAAVVIAGGMGLVSAETLGEAAARQKKRREEAAKQAPAGAVPEKPRVFTEADLQRYEKEQSVSDQAAAPTTGATGAAAAPPAAAAPDAAGKGGSGETAFAAMFREKLAKCRADLADARRKLAEAEATQPLVPGSVVGAKDANDAIRLRQWTIQLSTGEVERLERNCDIIERDALKSGVRPSELQ